MHTIKKTLLTFTLTTSTNLGWAERKFTVHILKRIFVTIPDMKNAEELYCHPITFRNSLRKAEPLKPCIDCARLLREAVFVALPRKVDTMLPRGKHRLCDARQPRAIDTRLYPIVGRVFLLPVHRSPRHFRRVKFRPSRHVQLTHSYIKR
jgi:hypothetical protein